MNKIGVIGLGRLGLCLALNLENVGYEVWGYDISKQRINDIKNKKVITTEPGVSLLLERQKNLHVTDYCRDVLHECDVIFVVIATPSGKDGKYNHDYINNFINSEVIPFGKVNKKHLIINSTVMPGYSDYLHDYIKDLGWHVSYNPEFIAQGSIIYDQQHPDMILIGARNEEAGNAIEDIYTKLCINKPVFCKMNALEAEITKIGLNCFLATKISYANMIGDICKKVGANEVKVLNAIGSDTRVGNKYLKWGYGYGGECIPRDHRALGIFAKENGITDVISKATDMYNDLHLEYQLDQFLADHKKKTVFKLEDGVAFKKGTDILTESQQLKFALRLIKEGYVVEIIDRKEVLEQVEKLYPNMFILTERD